MGDKKKGKPGIEICTGSSCKKAGAKKLKEAVEAQLERAGQGAQLKVKECDCLSACKKASAVRIRHTGEVLREQGSGNAEAIVGQAMKGLDAKKTKKGKKDGKKKAAELAAVS